MGTCRVARKVVLEAWRKEVEEINVQEVEGEGGEAWRKEAVKTEVLEVLDRLIEAL